MKGWWWAIVLMVLIVFLDSVSPNLFGFGKKKEKEEGMEEEMGGKEKEKEKEKGVRTKEDELKKEKRKLREESKKTEKNKVVIGKEEDSYHLVITRWNENLTWVKDFFVNENNYINNNNNNNNNNNINNNNINNDHNYNYKIDITIIQKLQDKSKEEEEAIQRKIQEGTLSYQDMILSPSKEKERELEKEEWYKQKKRVKVDFISNTNKIGRECSGYIFYILKNYYSLPTWVEFVHGAPEKSAFLARRYLTQPRGFFFFFLFFFFSFFLFFFFSFFLFFFFSFFLFFFSFFFSFLFSFLNPISFSPFSLSFFFFSKKKATSKASQATSSTDASKATTTKKEKETTSSFSTTSKTHYERSESNHLIACETFVAQTLSSTNLESNSFRNGRGRSFSSLLLRRERDLGGGIIVIIWSIFGIC